MATAEGSPTEPLRPIQDRLYIGKLLEHGRANHEFHRQGHPSYYVKLLADRQTRILWGKGLERALVESRTQPKEGDLIGVRQNNPQPLSVVVRSRGADGVVTATRQFDTPRPHWVIEKLAEFDLREAGARMVRDPSVARREAVLSQRELKPFYWVLDAGQAVADTRIHEPERQQAFMKLLRETLAIAYVRGEPAPLPSGAAAAKTNGYVNGSAPEREIDRTR